VEFDWDDRKAASNLAKHGVAFEVVYELDWDVARVRIDDRKTYGEVRLLTVLADPNGLRYLVVFTPRHGKHRIISVRRAGRKEVAQWQ
jgi:uncharacterized DUF497 family protein